eukprot:CAMPEP_0174702914 /NCGR_PEP_ID=MMETSP1094-20130205/7044_1 /TAXON_ID=156173 /ORGANISM="Chrysochromulina brevifilum, Strain UTEX LB 985" /LENGTH=637 /DNA_ID=CAMNT_0015900769 /DNA_START=52 /DNA_END=1965 /DNA_ORIENTATION=+
MQGDDDNDMDVELQIKKNLWKNHRLFPPDHIFVRTWFSCLMVLVMYNAVYIPIELCFEEQLGKKHGAHIAIDFLVDGIFLCDIVINFRTVYYNEDQEMVLDVKMIKRRYLKGWFALDLFASLPYDVIGYIAGADASANLGALGLLKLPRLLRLAKLLKKLDQLSGATTVRVIYVVGGFVMVNHWIGCVWWAIGMAEFNSPERSDVKLNSSYGIPWPSRVPGAPLGPWSSLAQAYLSSLFQSLTLVAKAPWVGPDTIGEKIFMCFAISMGALIFAVLLTFVSALTRQSQSHSAAKREQIAKVRGMAAYAGLNAIDTRRLVNHVDSYWDLTSGLNDNKILSQVPNQLRAEIIRCMHRETIHFSSLFRQVSEECTIQLLARLQTELLLRREILVAPSQALEKVSMMMRGTLTLSADEGSPLYEQVKLLQQSGGPAAASAKKSKMDRMGGMAGGGNGPGIKIMQQVIEKPGACIGGSKLFKGEADLYPVAITCSSNKTVTLSIRTGDLENILRIFGKSDSDACCKTLAESHTRLIESMMPSAARRSSVSGSSLRLSHNYDHLPEDEKIAKEEEKRRVADEQARQKKAEEAAARAVLAERVNNLEASAARVQQSLELCKKNMDAIPNIINLLKMTGALQDDA